MLLSFLSVEMASRAPCCANSHPSQVYGRAGVGGWYLQSLMGSRDAARDRPLPKRLQ